MKKKSTKSFIGLILVLTLIVTLWPAMAAAPAEAAVYDSQDKAIYGSENGGDPKTEALDNAYPGQLLYLTERGRDDLIEQSEDAMDAYFEGEAVTVQWVREKDGTATKIAGQTGYTYTVASGDIGANIYVEVTVGGDTIKSAKVQIMENGSKDSPLKLVSGQAVTRSFVSGGANHWYAIDVPDESRVTIELNADFNKTYPTESGPSVFFSKDGNYSYREFELSAGKTKSKVIGEGNGGTYFLCFNDDRYTGTYTLKVTVEPFNWGKIKVEGLENVTPGKDEIPFSFDLVDADESVHIVSWSYGSDPSNNHDTFDASDITRVETYLRTTTSYAGMYKLKVVLDSDEMDNMNSVYIDIPIKPAVVTNFTLSTLSVGYKSVKFNRLGNSTDNGSQILIQQYKSGKWTTVKKVKAGASSTTVSGLKSNTTYKFRLVGYVPASDGDPALTGVPTKSLTFKTGYNVKPQIKSIKTYGAKYNYVKKKWHPGYWSPSGKYYSGYYTGGYYTTTYKVKVTLKKKLPAQAGLIIDGKKVSGKGKTFTRTCTERGKLKGKKTYIDIKGYRSKTYLGYTPTVTKKVKVKK